MKLLKKTCLVMSLFVILICTSCSLFLIEEGPVPILVYYDRIALMWDYKNSSTESMITTINHYDVFYRKLGFLDWEYLSSTEGTDERIEISVLQTGYGDFEFGVQAIYNGNGESEIHSSLDLSANPPGGWFLKWIK